MNTNKILKISGTMLDKNQLEQHLEKLASSHNLINKSDKSTYPVPHMLENFSIIEDVYNLLNEHLKLGISIHPAGEWLLDNFYIVEETVKQIQKELTLKKYQNFLGIASGQYKGFARIYVVASEIVAFTDNKIDKKDLGDYLASYQSKKNLSMEEIWNIGIFLQIAIIENIAEICEKIRVSQIEKYKAENIAERLIENKEKNELVYNNVKRFEKVWNMQYPFVEYMSYILKRYGKKGYSYLKVLEETVELTGQTVSEIIKKEHFDIATKKVSIGNSIISIKKIQRINFLEIFEKINGVEELLRQDPSGIYEKMDNKTKEYYRSKIKEISKKTKMAEIYIAKKALELARANENEMNEQPLQKNKLKKENHIGYYLIDNGVWDLYQNIGFGNLKKENEKDKAKIYVLIISFFSIIISGLITCMIRISNIWLWILSFFVFLIPASEVVVQIVQYILGKIVKPKLIPKLDFSDGIPKESSTMVIIPTIVKTKEKVQELTRKLEVYYLANKSENLYFTLLGDCSQSAVQEEEADAIVIKEGKEQVKKLNEKYGADIFNFIYRKREWNEKENAYLGWERKRGMINQLNEYLLGNIKNPFRANTFEENSTPRKVKYVITLDADTDLILNSAFELVGAMSHILNLPVIDEKKNVVVDGYGIMQPRVGINLDISYKNLFTKIFAGSGGIDSYTNAISDIYQDNFKEGIFTGKGIYDLNIFSKVLRDRIPENKVLSHDLLEGCYLRCGLASDILLMDGYPTKYTSFMNRLSRWIRGDWQIISWLKAPFNLISKYKIFDNLRRSLLEFSIIVAMIFVSIYGLLKNQKVGYSIWILIVIAVFPFILEFLNILIFKREGEQKQKTFTPKISGIKGILYRGILTLGNIPYKAYISIQAVIKTIYRVTISKKHLLEWLTSEEAEKQAKSSLISYYNQMAVNVLAGFVAIGLSFLKANFWAMILGIIWIIIPAFMWYISKEQKEQKAIEKLNREEKEYVKEIGKKTWEFFETYLNKENNYLITDNYQEGRKEKIVARTSSTNIGLSLLAVISAYDLNYIEKEKALELLRNIIYSIESLPKWNGHLYNWYQTKTKEPLMPRYISTVDSGNFVGYLYVTKSFLEENINKGEQGLEDLLEIIKNMINNTDFSVLYNWEQQIFSIGFNIEENKLTDSYYDLLASEARQASLVAIAKKDVPTKHWEHLGKSLTILGKYKGLISWSGTAFEYLMPNINIPKYEGSLLDESCKFMLMSQKEYAKKLNIPWGISEAAFNVKDLKANYQYKAFGIPWLGLKRGLADELVVSAYGGVLAIVDDPKDEIKNLKLLEQEGMYGKYGFYESIDFTPERVEKGKTGSVVKTYMAHHQGLILLSINNLFNDKILQKRFIENPEMEAVSILLQETMPESFIITKEKKEKVEKLKYTDYENYIQSTYNKIDERLIRGNVISNEDYTIAMNQKGQGVSIYKDIYINRFKPTDDYAQGIFFTIKNIKTKKIWSSNYGFNERKENYQISFMPDKDEQEIIEGSIKTKIETTISSSEPVEIRRMTLENQGNEEEILEITSYFEPVLSKKEQDYAHPVFNNLFLITKFDEEIGTLLVKRKKRGANEKEIYLTANLFTNCETIGDLEYEIDESKFIGRGNLGIPIMAKNSIPLSKRIGLVTEPIVALKRTIKLKPNEKADLTLVICVGETLEQVKDNNKKYMSFENINTEFELSKARVEAESRYLSIKGKEIEIYQKILSRIIFDNSTKSLNMKNQKEYRQSDLWKYGISGDLPIILLKVRNVNETHVIKEVLKAYEFFRTKNIETELVILDEEKHSYENYVKEEIEGAILSSHMAFLKNIKGGIFSLSKGEIEPEDVKLLEFVSAINIDSSKGGLKNAINEIEEEYLERYKEIGDEENRKIIFEEPNDDINILEDAEKLKYYNEYGGFSADGKEYLIKINKKDHLPTVWSHILANEKFGTVVTENMGGYSWYKNSRLNRISSWGNNPSYDIPSEIIYMKDVETQKTWSIGANPKPDDRNYNVVYGFGYCKYIHKSNGIEQELEIFVPKEESCKVEILTLKNMTPNRKKLKLYYYVKPVLGEDELKTNGHINVKFIENSNIVFASNLYKTEELENKVYIACSEKIESYTGDKNFFLGNGGLSNPQGIRKVRLNNDTGLGKKSCMAYEIEIELENYGTKEISLVLGAEDNLIDCKNTAYKFSKIANCKQELTKCKNYWKELLRKTSSLHANRINQYNSKWMDIISNTGK